MSLDLSRLENVKRDADGTIHAACPACREAGKDKTGNHLLIHPDGRFGCAMHPGDGKHRKRISALASQAKGKPNGRPGSRIVAEYSYADEAGCLLFQVCRFDPKDFRQRAPDGRGGWRWTTKGVRRVLYRLPQVLAAVADGLRVFICEGEKDAGALEQAGFAATCNPGGAGKWMPDYTAALKGASVCIIADKDNVGRAHAALVAHSLQGVAVEVRVIECPDLEGKPVKDPSDFFAAGGDAATLDDLAENSPLWTPPPAESPGTKGSVSSIQAELRGQIMGHLLSKAPAATKRKAIANLVVTFLTRIGHFYSHAELRDFDSCMFFDGQGKRLLRIQGDAFVAWLSDWVAINRADIYFRFILAAVETAALTGSETSPIVPEAYWASRPGAVYLSNGDGQAVRIDSEGIQLVDNGTDGVLFAAGKSLAPWRLTEPRSVFETCRLFSATHADAGHGQDLLRVWIYSLPTNPRSKPPLCLVGDIGSGKTRTVKGIAEFYGIPFVAQKVEESGESDFWPCLNEGGLYCLDNADTRCRWLADAIANAATDGCSRRRKLYSNAETVTLRARAWLAVTTANPTFASDAGLADRILPFRMARRDEETSDAALSDEIAANRDAGLSHIAHTTQRALSDRGSIPANLNSRHPDFAAFAVRIGRALGREAEVIAALEAAEADKSAFCLENDPVGFALLASVGDGSSFVGTAAELLPKLIAVDHDLEEHLTPKRLGKRLSRVWPHLAKALARCDREKDRNGITKFTFQGKPAGFAGFQTLIPPNFA